MYHDDLTLDKAKKSNRLGLLLKQTPTQLSLKKVNDVLSIHERRKR